MNTRRQFIQSVPALGAAFAVSGQFIPGGTPGHRWRILAVAPPCFSEPGPALDPGGMLGRTHYAVFGAIYFLMQVLLALALIRWTCRRARAPAS
jgi:hypothetical protein